MSFRLPDNPKIYITIAILAGVIWGIIRPTFLSGYDLAGLIANLHQFSHSFNTSYIGSENLAVSLLRNGHVLLLVWACTAIPKFFWVAYLPIYMRAMTASFSVTLMVHAFGVRGLLMSVVLNLPQNILVLAVCAYTICHIKQANKIKLVVMCIFAIIISSAYEIFIAPQLFLLVR